MSFFKKVAGCRKAGRSIPRPCTPLATSGTLRNRNNNIFADYLKKKTVRPTPPDGGERASGVRNSGDRQARQAARRPSPLFDSRSNILTFLKKDMSI